jgi:hypothetical protein
MDLMYYGWFDDYRTRFIKPRILNEFLALFFAAYAVMNCFGNNPWKLWSKPDGGNIGEVLRLTQHWNMFADMRYNAQYDYVVADVELEIVEDYRARGEFHAKNDAFDARNAASRTVGRQGSAQILYNDLQTSGYKKASWYKRQTFLKHENPTYAWKSARWEKAIKKSLKKDDRIESMLKYLCREIDWYAKREHVFELNGDRQRHNTKRKVPEFVRQTLGSPSNNTALVKLKKVTKVSMCTFWGAQMRLEKQLEKGLPRSFETEWLGCRHVVDCATGEGTSLKDKDGRYGHAYSKGT